MICCTQSSLTHPLTTHPLTYLSLPLQNGAMDEQTLVELAEMYAERFSIESLEVFDAVTALWAHTNNQTGFATPHQQQDTVSGSHGVT